MSKSIAKHKAYLLQQAPISWEPVDVTPRLVDGKTTIPSETIESIQRNKVALKGPLAVSPKSSPSSRPHFSDTPG